VVLHKIFNRKVVLHPDNTVVKSKRIALGEAEATRVAAHPGFPAPYVHDVHATPDGRGHMSMGYIRGQPLDKLWPDMSAE
jgi:hypothetical protein